MSDADRRKWDERYRNGAYAERPHPSTLLAQWLPQLPRGRALDLACGAGRNSVFLAQHGYRVDAVDISEAGLERARAAAAASGVAAGFAAADLEDPPPGLLDEPRYALIVMVRYVNRALLPRLAGALAEGGCLLVEQHLRTRAAVAGPRTPEFRYAPNEMLHDVMAASDPSLRVLLYREAVLDDPDGRAAALAQLVACRGEGPY